MIKIFKNTIHIKLDNEDMETMQELINNKRSGLTEFDCLLVLFANYNDYNIFPVGESYCIGNDCLAYECLANGGEHAIIVKSYQYEQFMNGKTVIFKKYDYRITSDEESEIEIEII